MDLRRAWGEEAYFTTKGNDTLWSKKSVPQAKKPKRNGVSPASVSKALVRWKRFPLPPLLLPSLISFVGLLLWIPKGSSVWYTVSGLRSGGALLVRWSEQLYRDVPG